MTFEDTDKQVQSDGDTQKAYSEKIKKIIEAIYIDGYESEDALRKTLEDIVYGNDTDVASKTVYKKIDSGFTFDTPECRKSLRMVYIANRRSELEKYMERFDAEGLDMEKKVNRALKILGWGDDLRDLVCEMYGELESSNRDIFASLCGRAQSDDSNGVNDTNVVNIPTPKECIDNSILVETALNNLGMGRKPDLDHIVGADKMVYSKPDEKKINLVFTKGSDTIQDGIGNYNKMLNPKKRVRFASYAEAYEALNNNCSFISTGQIMPNNWYSWNSYGTDENILLDICYHYRKKNFYAKTKKRCIEKAFEYYGWSTE